MRFLRPISYQCHHAAAEETGCRQIRPAHPRCASDADRDRVIELLHAAVANGGFDPAESARGCTSSAPATAAIPQASLNRLTLTADGPGRPAVEIAICPATSGSRRAASGAQCQPPRRDTQAPRRNTSHQLAGQRPQPPNGCHSN
jgi:hypothetical protein